MARLTSPPSVWERLISAPIYFLTHEMFMFVSSQSTSNRHKDSIRVVCISDTHNHISLVPNGDVLIHAGDLSRLGTVAELQVQIDWLDSLPHKTKVVVAGNHDSWLDPEVRARLDESRAAGIVKWKSLIYLQDSSHQIRVPSPSNEKAVRTLTVYGSPWVPKVGGKDNFYAFQYPRASSHDQWRNKIPQETQILVIHTPPRHYMDAAYGRTHLGCDGLLDELWRAKPALAVFGHIHAGRGKMVLRWDTAQRAYERACSRTLGTNGGLLEVLNIFAWIDLLLVIALGACSLARSWAVCDVGETGTVLVNAAMRYDESGNQIGPVQIIDL